jgi:hypothetical protein
MLLKMRRLVADIVFLDELTTEDGHSNVLLYRVEAAQWQA